MRDGLYHYTIGFPRVRLPVGLLPLRYSKHAQREMLSDRYAIINPPATLDVGKAKIIELETFRGEAVKFVARIPHSPKHDLVLVVKPDGFVKTVWLNERNDRHSTLNKSKYLKP